MKETMNRKVIGEKEGEKMRIEVNGMEERIEK